jgi:protein phosphatase
MPSPSVLEIASATDTGKVRSHNEDSIAADAEIGLAVLADGLGGYNAGEVASGIAVATLMTEIKRSLAGREPHEANDATSEQLAVRLIKESSARANAAIYQAARSQPRYAGMGTTLVAALFYGSRVTVGHVGDSRLYRLRQGKLEQITRDHSQLQEQIDSGLISEEQARYAQNRNVVTRAVGIEPGVETEVHAYDVGPGDIYLLCSDGLSDMVADDDIHATLGKLQSSLPLAAQQLVQLANVSGGRDNISVILARVPGGRSTRI